MNKHTYRTIKRSLFFFAMLVIGSHSTGMTPIDSHIFISAAAEGNLEQLTQLWHQHAELYRYTHTDEQALLEASEHGHNHIILFLIANGVDARTHRDRALYNAAETGNVSLMRILLPIVSAECSAYKSKKQAERAQAAIDHAYTLAAYHSHFSIVKLLYPAIMSSSVHALALRNAAFCGSTDIMLYLLEHQTSVHPHASLPIIDTALHAAALNGHAHAAQLLLDEQTNAEELSDAILAARNGKHDETVALLCAHGINLSGKRPNH